MASKKRAAPRPPAPTVQPGPAPGTTVNYPTQSNDTVSHAGAVDVVTLGDTGNTPPPPPPPPPPPDPHTDVANSASAIIDNTLAGVGLGNMSSWANGLASQLAGKGLASGDIQNTILSQLNNPTNADGSVNQDALAAFNAAMPGFNQRIANGYGNGSPGSTPLEAIAAYSSYTAQAQAMGRQAGLPQGFMTPTEIGNLWAGDVSPDELSTRITQGFANAMAAPPDVRQHLQDYYGVSTGGLAAYYLDPNNALPILQQHFNAASVGGAGTMTGFGEMGQANAQTLAAFLAQPTSTGPGTVSEAQAANALTNSLGAGMTGVAQMAKAGFETALPGATTNSPGVVTQDQLLEAVEGNAGALADVRRATETRTAGSRGGGGYSANPQGVSGVGFGSQQ